MTAMAAAPPSPLGLSVVIPNYNYQEFVGQAIESALAVDAPRVQVIVVDDGSTDNSREVIERYRGRVTIVHQANAGQREAYNAGFRLASEELVIFLDADDLLDASVFRQIAPLWRAGISKLQFRMRTIDAHGRPLGNVIPQYADVPEPQQIRRWAATTTAYPTPPGSGNAYARRFLEQIFPLDDSCGKPGDASCLAAAPFLGDVVTVPVVLASYRVHGRNDGAASSLDVRQIQLHVVRTWQRHVYAARIARRVGIEIKHGAVNGSLSYLPYRVSSLRLGPQTHPLVGDSPGAALGDVLRALFKPQGMSWRNQCAVALWAALVLTLPRAAARRLVFWRFVPAGRPLPLRRGLALLGLIR
jgi:glycosyltransferase involved in cell wall biosynthesis